MLASTAPGMPSGADDQGLEQRQVQAWHPAPAPSMAANASAPEGDILATVELELDPEAPAIDVERVLPAGRQRAPVVDALDLLAPGRPGADGDAGVGRRPVDGQVEGPVDLHGWCRGRSEARRDDGRDGEWDDAEQQPSSPGRELADADHEDHEGDHVGDRPDEVGHVGDVRRQAVDPVDEEADDRCR